VSKSVLLLEQVRRARGSAPKVTRYRLEELTHEVRCAIRDTVVRIWSREHGSWWRPDGHGYTNLPARAWQLPLGEAWRRTSHCGPEKGIEFGVVQ
jgi:hypothetical protein